MRNLICFLALVAWAAATIKDAHTIPSRSLSEKGEAAILKIREQMPYGFPKYGIPPLAPFLLNHSDIDIDTAALRLSGTVDDLRLEGMNDFDLVDFKVNVIRNKVKFFFMFNTISGDTQYKLELLWKKAGFTIHLIGAGPARFVIKQLEISGNLQYSFGVVSKILQLKTIDAKVHIGEVESDIKGILGDGHVNYKMNEILKEAVETLINENNEFISKTIESKVFPIINDKLINKE